MSDQPFQPLSPGYISRLLDSRGLWLSKNRGQNYLVDQNAVDRIIAEVPQGLPVLEVGCGLGALTHKLVLSHSVTAIEIDHGIVETLHSVFTHPNLNLIRADFLEYPLHELPEPEYYFVSNLPYSISGEALRAIIEAPVLKKGVVMVQKEFFERMTAAPRAEVYGAFAVLCQVFLKAELLFHVGRSSFFPKPTVDSVVVRFEKKETDISQKDMKEFLRTAFLARRKTLWNNLKPLGLTREEFERYGVRPEARPEELSPVEWEAFYRAWRQEHHG